MARHGQAWRGKVGQDKDSLSWWRSANFKAGQCTAGCCAGWLIPSPDDRAAVVVFWVRVQWRNLQQQYWQRVRRWQHRRAR